MNPFEAMLEQHRADPAAFRQHVVRRARAARTKEMRGWFAALRKGLRLRAAVDQAAVRVAA